MTKHHFFPLSTTRLLTTSSEMCNITYVSQYDSPDSFHIEPGAVEKGVVEYTPGHRQRFSGSFQPGVGSAVYFAAAGYFHYSIQLLC